MKSFSAPLFLAAVLAAASGVLTSSPCPAQHPARKTPEPALGHAFAMNRPARLGDRRHYAPFYGYVIGPHAVVERGKILCALQNPDGQPIVMAYDVAAGRWSEPVRASLLGLKGDDHGNPSISIDRQGRLHVFYGCHGGPMRHTRSTKPFDITTWQEQPPPTSRATYPQTMRMADGTICLFYRAGGHMEPWSLRTSEDDCQTWSEAMRIIEMRLDPPDRLAAAYCQFFPGPSHQTIHCFWNHKDDNAARVSDQRPHPWRPLKYRGLHEAVYRYNVYYVHRNAEGTWQNAAGEPVELPVSKAEADAKCLVYDSGDQFTFLGNRQAVDREDRPYFKFGCGVVDWARVERRVIVPPVDKYAQFAAGRWQIHEAMPDSWPPEVRRTIESPGPAAYGGPDAAGWSIFCHRSPIEPDAGATVFLYHDERGFATRPGGPAKVP